MDIYLTHLTLIRKFTSTGLYGMERRGFSNSAIIYTINKQVYANLDY